MKILIVSQYFWPEHFVVNSLSLELKKRGHEVTVLTGLPNYPRGSFFSGYDLLKGPWAENYHGIQVKRIPIIPRGNGLLNLAFNYLSFVVSGILFGKARLENDYDVIFCMGLSPVTSCLPAVFLRWRLTKPLIFWVQDLWPESVAAVGAAKSKVMLGAIGKIVRFIYRRCDLILVQSKAFKESVIRWGGDADKIQYVPNWAKVPDINQAIPDWISQLPHGFKVVFAGNIGKAQDMNSIVKAAQLLRNRVDIHWIIVGEGSDKTKLDEAIARLDLRQTVHTYGRRPNEDMPSLFANADVLLVTLTDEHIFSLTIPSKIQGYMASGKPILAAMNGEGARVVNETGCGLSCPAENPQAMAEAVVKLYEMPELLRSSMGKSGFEYFRNNFEESIVIRQIEDACVNLVKRNSFVPSLPIVQNYKGPSIHFLVTGATGFVGRSLCALLAQNGHRITAVSRTENSQQGVKKYLIRDWKDASEWASVLAGVDVIVHLAARVHVMNDKSKDPLSEFRDANLENTRVLATAALKSNVKKFIFLSSILVNGTGTTEKPYRADDKPNPSDPYSVSKLETEIFLEDFFKDSPIDLVTIRPPLIYGPGCRGNFLRLLNLARNFPLIPLGGFHNRRSMIFVENLSDFIHKVATSPSRKKLYLVSDAKDLGLGEMVEKLATFMGNPGRVVYFPKSVIKFILSAVSRKEEYHKVASDLLVDSTDAQKDFQWTPPYSAEEGLKATVDWHSFQRNELRN